MINLKVLILTSENKYTENIVVNLASSNTLFDSEVDNYIKMLVSSNIPFDIKPHREITIESIVTDGAIKYSSIILTIPETQLSIDCINILQKVSFDFGVSIITSFSHIGSKTKQLFGVDEIRGFRLSLRCIISVDTDKLANLRIKKEIQLGNGLKIGWQRHGLRRHPLRYFTIHTKKFLRQVFFYFKVTVAPEAEILAFVHKTSNPAITKHAYGKATNYYLSLQSNTFLTRPSSMHKIVRDLIIKNSGWGMVNIDLENTIALRMDDPGTCERIYLKGYDSRLMTKDEWKQIPKLLKKHHAKLSVMYIPKWIDDANNSNGSLYIGGKKVEKRQAGKIYNSKDVFFIRNMDGKCKREYDYTSEYQALCDTFYPGIIEMESHGLTHVDPNISGWLSAKDRYINYEWYHEFRHVVEKRDVDENQLIYILRESSRNIHQCFGVLPTVITPSGHEQSQNADILAFKEGYKLFSSGYNATKKPHLIIRNDKIESIFFENTKPSRSHLEGGYPVVGVFHDYDISKKGMEWLDETLRQWVDLGFNRFITLKELAGYLCSSIIAQVEEKRMNIEIDITDTGDVSNKIESRYFFYNPMTIAVTLPKRNKIESVELDHADWKNLVVDKSRELIKISIPEFAYKDKQKVTINFEKEMQF